MFRPSGGGGRKPAAASGSKRATPSSSHHTSRYRNVRTTAPAAMMGRGGAGQRTDYTLDDCAASLPMLVLLHVGSWAVYNKMRGAIANLNGVPRRIVVTLVPACWDHKETLEQPGHWGANGVLSVDVLQVPNRGMDVGGFLEGYAFARAQYGGDCVTVLKLHTKTSDSWRNQLVRPLMGDHAAVLRMLYAMTHPRHGMYCSRQWMMPAETFEHAPNTPLIDEWMGVLGLKRHPGHNRFVAGTVFLCKSAVLERMFAEEGVLERLIEAMPEGRVNDRLKGQLPHTMERVLGYAVTACGLHFQSA